ncbi:MAG: hypothetical protein A2054_08895 [Deltaproteobacteria bacterium GWA2_55_10]|nr:MAG: hypothetical protein A2054_08895 [Deltaproteobacteria bacterium GWA2_55_10]
MKRFFLAISLASVVFAGQANSEVVDRIVAVINDSVITLSELNAATAVAIEKLGIEDGADPDKLKEVKGTILDSLVEQKLVKQAADKAGIDISEREIDNAVDDVKKQNRLTHEQLLLALAESGLTQKEYREQLKEQIRQAKFINKEFRSKISIQPEDIEGYYRQNIGEFQGAALYRLNMIFLPADKSLEGRLKAVSEGLANGEDFRDLASHFSEGPGASQGGDLGFLKSGELDSWLEDAARRLKPNDISPAIQRPEGVYFIQLTEFTPSAPKPLAEVKGQIHDKLFKKVMDERFNFWLSEVKRTAHLEIRM